MKAIHIVGDSKFGGGAIVILKIVQAMLNNGYEVFVLATDYEVSQFFLNNGIACINLDVIWRSVNPFKDVFGLFKLTYFLKKSKFGIVHTHTSKAGLVGRIAAKLAGVPIIIHTVHGFPFHGETGKIMKVALILIERLLSIICNRVVTVSEYHANLAKELKICRKDKVLAIPNGISVERIKLQSAESNKRSELGISEERLVLLTFGRLVKQKGIEYLIDAFNLLYKYNYKNISVVIVGDGELRNKLERLAGEHLSKKRILFMGFRENVSDYIDMSDIVVLPSLWEGLSISLLEAMASGKPIVTTNIPSNTEVLEDKSTGLLVNVKNSEEIAIAIIRLIEDRNLMKVLGENAKRAFYNKYTEKAMMDGYLKLYADELVKMRC